MSLAVAGTFGSLPEASVALSSLASAGFNPVAGYNMNTPGIAGGMAPSAYRVLVPDDEVQGARQFLREFRLAFATDPDEPDEVDALDEDEKSSRPTTLGRVRVAVRFLVAGVLIAWIVTMAFALLRR